MSNLEKMLTLVRDGQIGFAEFVHKTQSEFARMACHLMRRWASPEWFTLEDMMQELYAATWKYLPKYKSSFGVKLSRYIVFNAMAVAKTQLHKARGVTISGTPDKKRSNIETPLTMFGDDGEGEALMTSILNESPRAEDALIAEEDRKQAITVALKTCTSENERYAVLAIREAGSLDDAGRVLYDDFDHRIDLRLHSEAHADRFVLRQARAVARRLVEVSATGREN